MGRKPFRADRQVDAAGLSGGVNHAKPRLHGLRGGLVHRGKDGTQCRRLARSARTIAKTWCARAGWTSGRWRCHCLGGPSSKGLLRYRVHLRPRGQWLVRMSSQRPHGVGIPQTASRASRASRMHSLGSCTTALEQGIFSAQGPAVTRSGCEAATQPEGLGQQFVARGVWTRGGREQSQSLEITSRLGRRRAGSASDGASHQEHF